MLWCGAVAAAKTITVLFCSHERFISQTSERKPINPAGQICSHKEPHLNARTESIQRTSIYSAAHKHARGRKLISRQILSLWCALLFPLSVCTAAGCMCAKSSGFKIKKKYTEWQWPEKKKQSVILHHFPSRSTAAGEEWGETKMQKLRLGASSA